MTQLISIAAEALLALIGGWLVPFAGMLLLVPALRASGLKVTNYRGAEVFLGLGLVWVFWVAGVGVFGFAGTVSLVAFGGGITYTAGAVAVAAAALTVIWALLFGLIDDVFGTSADKGFKGHFKSLASGRLSTGALKALGIGLVALAAGAQIASRRELFGMEYAIVLVCSAAVIALCANLVNLMDMRPGRAIKGYGVLCVFGACALAYPLADGMILSVATALIALIWLLGPVIAIARWDFAEEGMLGDAGANAAGALAGFALAFGLSTGALVLAAIALLALNALSERVSYSRLIESNSLLSRIDLWGRQSL